MIGSTNAWLGEWLRGLGQLALLTREVFGSLLSAKTRLGGRLYQLTVLTSNLNRYGLLYKPRPPRTQPLTPNIHPGK